MTFKQRPELREGVTLADIWRKSVPAQGQRPRSKTVLGMFGDSKEEGAM